MVMFREIINEPPSTREKKPGNETIQYNGSTSTEFRMFSNALNKFEVPIPKKRSQVRKISNLNTVADRSKQEAVSEKDRKSLYEEAHAYLNQVMIAVRNQRKFDLTWGLQIMREIVASLSPNDKILIHAIHSENLYNYVVGHSVNVAIFAAIMGQSLGYNRKKMAEVGLVGLLHDVGMGLIPNEIIYKKEKLTKKEYEVLKQRPFYGFKILEKFSEEHPYLAECALQVYERIDGSGYPKALKEDEIHEYAQIVGLAAVYEALIHSRPQREKFLHFVAAKEIIKTGKKSFKTEHLKALLKIFSVFPINTTVRLNSGAIGRVLETYPDQPMRPKLQILYDSQKRKVLTNRIIDLPENPLLYILDAVSDEELSELSGDIENKEEDHEDAPSFTDGAILATAMAESQEDFHNQTDVIQSTEKPKRQWGSFGIFKVFGIVAGGLIVCFIALAVWYWYSTKHDPIKPAPKAVQRFGILNEPVITSEPDMPRNVLNTAIAVPAPVEVEIKQTSQERQELHHLPEIEAIPDSTAGNKGVEAYSETVDETATPITNMQMELKPEDMAPAYPFSVKVASYKTREEVREAMPELLDMGISPYWVKVDLGNDGIWYRVFTGHFRRFEEARAYIAEKGLKEAIAKKTSFSTVVGKYSNREMAAMRIKELKANGHSPYLIRRDNGSYIVYIGAFYTRKGAEDQSEALRKDGIWNKEVER